MIKTLILFLLVTSSFYIGAFEQVECKRFDPLKGSSEMLLTISGSELKRGLFDINFWESKEELEAGDSLISFSSKEAYLSGKRVFRSSEGSLYLDDEIKEGQSALVAEYYTKRNGPLDATWWRCFKID